MQVRSILAAVDLEEHCDRVVIAALKLAAAFECPLKVLHVSEPPVYLPSEALGSASPPPAAGEAMDRYAAQAERALKELVANLKPQVETETAVSVGRPVQAIMKELETTQPDLLVTGTHGRRGVERWLLGSNAAQLVRRVRVPVLAVNTREREREGWSLERIAVASDFSDSAAEAERWALALARLHGSSVNVIHVVEERFHPYLPFHVSDLEAPTAFGGYFEAVRERCERLARDSEQRFAVAGVEARVTLVEDAASVADGLVRALQDAAADLVVMGTHGRTGLDRALLGSVAEKLVQLSPCPVLTIRSPSPG